LPTYSEALAALIEPAPEPIVRDTAPTRARLAELADEHLHHVRYLHERYLLAEVAGNVDGAERALCALTEAGTRYRANKAAITAEHPDPPSLLQQLLDAVHGSGGSNGAGGAGAHRSPAALAAVDLIAHIRRTVDVHPGPYRAGDEQLHHDLRCWRPEDEAAASMQLLTWAIEIRALIDPPRSLEGTRPCPACGTRFVRVQEGDEWIRRAAIRIVYHNQDGTLHPNDFAECLAPACGERWERSRWNLLAAAMQTTDPAG